MLRSVLAFSACFHSFIEHSPKKNRGGLLFQDFTLRHFKFWINGDKNSSFLYKIPHNRYMPADAEQFQNSVFELFLPKYEKIWLLQAICLKKKCQK
jgi:hypothetical protein